MFAALIREKKTATWTTSIPTIKTQFFSKFWGEPPILSEERNTVIKAIQKKEKKNKVKSFSKFIDQRTRTFLLFMKFEICVVNSSESR